VRIADRRIDGAPLFDAIEKVLVESDSARNRQALLPAATDQRLPESFTKSPTFYVARGPYSPPSIIAHFKYV